MDLQPADIIELLDAPTTAPAWPKNGYAPAKESKETETLRQKANAKGNESDSHGKGPASTFHHHLNP